MGSVVRKKVNYFNNKDILEEIHKSKNSYCEFLKPEYQDFDIILNSVDDIFSDTLHGVIKMSADDTDGTVLDRAKSNRASRLGSAAYKAAQKDTEEKLKPSSFKISPDTINVCDLVFRIYTYEHIPCSPGRKKNPKSLADHHAKLAFIPFKHVMLADDGKTIVEVGRSHTKNGEFSCTHGSLTHKLATMYMRIVHEYSQRYNWRAYTYLDEFKGQALVQLVQMGLKFDESKSDNPFAYLTTSISNSFTRVLNIEKKNQIIRDNLLMASGANPSFSRQLDIEDGHRRAHEDAASLMSAETDREDEV